MQTQSAAFALALRSLNQNVVQQAVILSKGAPIASGPGSLASPLKVTGGSWDCDETRPIRRTCSSLVLGDPTGTLVPTQANSLLDPSSGNELQLSYGLVLPNGSIEMNVVGTFRQSKPKIVDNAANNLQITLGGNDRSVVISRNRWSAPFAIDPFITVDRAVILVLSDRWSGAPLDFSQIQPIDAQVPMGTVLGTTQTSDPWTDLQTMVTGAGYELFFDALGRPVTRQIIDPATVTLAASYAEYNPTTSPSQYGLLDTAERDLDESHRYNGVIVTSATVGSDPPAQAVVWDLDPASPFNVNVAGYVPAFYTSPLLLSPAQCQATAQRLLALVRRRSETATVTIPPNPGHEAGDGVYLQRNRAGLAGTYIAQSFSAPFGALGEMTLTSRSTSYVLPPHSGTLA